MGTAEAAASSRAKMITDFIVDGKVFNRRGELGRKCQRTSADLASFIGDISDLLEGVADDSNLLLPPRRFQSGQMRGNSATATTTTLAKARWLQTDTAKDFNLNLTSSLRP